MYSNGWEKGKLRSEQGGQREIEPKPGREHPRTKTPSNQNKTPHDLQGEKKRKKKSNTLKRKD